MAQAVGDLPQEVREKIEVRKWDMRNPRHLDAFRAAGVKKLPTIAIAGELVFEALIPDEEELIEKINNCFHRNGQ